MNAHTKNKLTHWGIWGITAAGITLVWGLSNRGVIARSSSAAAQQQLEGCCSWARAHRDVELLQVCERGASLPEILDVMNSRRAVHVQAE